MPTLELGQLMLDDQVRQALSAEGLSPAQVLMRHAQGDRGEIPPSAIEISEESLIDTVMSIYRLRSRDAIWVTTYLKWSSRVTMMTFLPAEWMEE